MLGSGGMLYHAAVLVAEVDLPEKCQTSKLYIAKTALALVFIAFQVAFLLKFSKVGGILSISSRSYLKASMKFHFRNACATWYCTMM